MTHDPAPFELMTDRLSPAEARLELRSRVDGGSIETATIQGPFCDDANTLPCKIAFRRDAKSQAWTTVVPDPCYWSPALPFRYRLNVGFRASSTDDAIPHLQWLGIKRYERRNGIWYLDGQRWIARGIDWNDERSEPAWKDLRAAGTTLVLPGMQVERFESATSSGVPLVVDLRATELTPATLHSLADYAAVRAAIVTVADLTTEFLNIALRKFSLSVVLDSQSSCEAQLARLQATAARYDLFVLIDAERFKEWPALAAWDYPIVPFRASAAEDDWQTRRAAADRLQADLAQYGDFAGYLCAGLGS